MGFQSLRYKSQCESRSLHNGEWIVWDAVEHDPLDLNLKPFALMNDES
jgi:hypothetical protein